LYFVVVVWQVFRGKLFWYPDRKWQDDARRKSEERARKGRGEGKKKAKESEERREKGEEKASSMVGSVRIPTSHGQDATPPAGRWRVALEDVRHKSG
jgi:hypothetical protein